jgi:hypothetical protein
MNGLDDAKSIRHRETSDAYQDYRASGNPDKQSRQAAKRQAVSAAFSTTTDAVFDTEHTF